MTYTGPVSDGPRPRAPGRSASVARAGVSFGSALAIAISWSEHHSVLWAILHGILSWLYVLYYLFTR